MKLSLKILIFLLLIARIITASGEPFNETTELQVIKNRVIIFSVDNKNEFLPKDILNQLNNVPLSELDDAIIDSLIRTKKYQNVLVKELYNKEEKKTVYFITANYVKKIQNITFNGINFSEQVTIQKNLTLLPGKIFNEYLLSEDKKKIENNMHLKGYPNAHIIDFRVEAMPNNFVTLIYTIQKGEPCQIDQITVENSIANSLNFINLPIETGSFCDVSSINDKLLQMRDNYWRAGYLTAEAKIKNIEYSQNKERAKLELTIEKGPKTIVQIQDENNKLNLI